MMTTSENTNKHRIADSLKLHRSSRIVEPWPPSPRDGRLVKWREAHDEGPRAMLSEPPAHAPEQLNAAKRRAKVAAIADHPQEFHPGDFVVR